MENDSQKWYVEITVKVSKTDEHGVIDKSRIRNLMYNDDLSSPRIASQCGMRTKIAVEAMMEQFD